MSLRRLLLALPVALAVAAVTHQIRWGDEHLFGQSFHDWIVTALYAGLPGAALTLALRSLSVAQQYADGSILAERLAELLPGKGRLATTTALLSGLAGALYVGIELTEDDGDRTFWLALAIIVVLAFATALGTRRLLGALARATLTFVGRRIGRSDPLLPLPLRNEGRRLATHRAWARVRLGRAPPLA
jgi:hypothetical protein